MHIYIYPSKKVNQINPLSTIVVDSVVKYLFFSILLLQFKSPSFNSIRCFIRSRCTNTIILISCLLYRYMYYTMVVPITHILSIDKLNKTIHVLPL